MLIFINHLLLYVGGNGLGLVLFLSKMEILCRLIHSVENVPTIFPDVDLDLVLSTHKLSWWTWQLICAVPCDLFKSSRIYGCLTTIISEVFVDIIFIPNLLKGVRGSL